MADTSTDTDAVKNTVGADRSGYIRQDRLKARLKELFSRDIEVFVSLPAFINWTG